jgi:ubiquinone/menaquinone biosynthesis C-methylase UbiE
MSLRGRHILDRLKRAVSPYLLLPVPPYESANYWEGVYQSFGPTDVFEWGNLSFPHHLQEYKYTRLATLTAAAAVRTAVHQQQEQAPETSPLETISTCWGETLNTFPVPEDQRKEKDDIDEPILILGCGNSKLGEDMLEPRRPLSSNDTDTLSRWRGPILQVDVSSRVIDAMGQRCHDYIQCGDMMVLQDDATQLSAISNETIHATIDKGLVDALFCANQPQQCYDVMQSVHRVLQPSGVLVILSFSRPEFLLETLLLPPHLHNSIRKATSNRMALGTSGWRSGGNSSKRGLQWGNVQIRQLDSILLYRFQKAAPPTVTSVNMSNSSSRPRKQQQSRPRRS